MSEGVRTVALAEGMDPDASPVLLYRALRLRRAQTMRTERDRATLLFNLTCFHLAHGKGLTYWDVAGHLYPADFIRKERERAEMERARASQMATLETMRMLLDAKSEGGKHA